MGKLFLVLLLSLCSFHCFSFVVKYIKRFQLPLCQASLLGKLSDFVKKKPIEKEKTEDDVMLEYLEGKPWRASKIKNLNITHRYI